MKRLFLLLSSFLFLSIFTFTSCKEDKYLDWKYINRQWYEQQKSLKEDGSDKNYWSETESGLLYRVINAGFGADNYTGRPSNKSGVVIDYNGRYFNGESFDNNTDYSSYVASFVSGFQEALKMMKTDAIYEVIIPYELGYGEEESTSIPPYSTLRFRIHLKYFVTG